MLGARGFTLALLHRMQDLDAGPVEDALKALEASRAELRESHNLWNSWRFSRTAPKGLRAFRVALGPPETQGPKAFGDLTCELARWRLPLWPDLRFEVLAAPDGTVLNQWLVRPGPPRVLPLDELAPWSAVIADVGASFPGAEHGEGAAPHHWTVDFVHEGAGYRARFVYGLLQSVSA